MSPLSHYSSSPLRRLKSNQISISTERWVATGSSHSTPDNWPLSNLRGNGAMTSISSETWPMLVKHQDEIHLVIVTRIQTWFPGSSQSRTYHKNEKWVWIIMAHLQIRMIAWMIRVLVTCCIISVQCSRCMIELTMQWTIRVLGSRWSMSGV